MHLNDEQINKLIKDNQRLKKDLKRLKYQNEVFTYTQIVGRLRQGNKRLREKVNILEKENRILKYRLEYFIKNIGKFKNE